MYATKSFKTLGRMGRNEITLSTHETEAEAVRAARVHGEQTGRAVWVDDEAAEEAILEIESLDLAYGELVYDELDRRYARFVRRVDGSAVVLMDRNTLKELPDYRHPSQVRRA
jgi:hypothetical protein